MGSSKPTFQPEGLWLEGIRRGFKGKVAAWPWGSHAGWKVTCAMDHTDAEMTVQARAAASKLFPGDGARTPPVLTPNKTPSSVAVFLTSEQKKGTIPTGVAFPDSLLGWVLGVKFKLIFFLKKGAISLPKYEVASSCLLNMPKLMCGTKKTEIWRQSPSQVLLCSLKIPEDGTFHMDTTVQTIRWELQVSLNHCDTVNNNSLIVQLSSLWSWKDKNRLCNNLGILCTEHLGEVGMKSLVWLWADCSLQNASLPWDKTLERNVERGQQWRIRFQVFTSWTLKYFLWKEAPKWMRTT